MKARAFDPLRLDVERFARESARLDGRWLLASFERLPSLPGAGSPHAGWQADGERREVAGAEPEVWLRLRADATLALVCQRCLAPVELPIAVDRRFRFARDEAAAEALDTELDDDVLSLERTLDLHALVEDELLLAAPLVPRHDRCPDGGLPLAADDEPGEAAPSPFAVLATLKKGEAER